MTYTSGPGVTNLADIDSQTDFVNFAPT